jgi:hypothetical protein
MAGELKMSKLKMPAKGNSAAMLAELQAEHATADEAVGQKPGSRPATAAKRRGAAAASPPPPEVSREQRVEFALERAASDEMTVITVRIPLCLNHYVDEYVARRRSLDPKSKYRKQDAIAEAFAGFYADHPLPAVSSDQAMLP